MKKHLLILMILCYYVHGYSQTKVNVDEIKGVCLKLEMINAKSNLAYKVVMQNRKIIASKTVSGIQTGKKVTKVDKKLYHLVKQSLFSKGNMYSLPDTIHCRQCANGTMVTLSVRTKAGKKMISGKDPEEENKDMKYILEYISGMVGIIDEF